MNRHTTFKLVLRLVLLGAVVLAVAGYTTALWSDSATSAGNVFATGNLDLKVRPATSGIAWLDGPVEATWHAENMYPGQDLGGGYIAFKNAGTVMGTSFDIVVSNTNTVPEMDKYIQITEMTYLNHDPHDLLSDTDAFHIDDLNHNGWVDLDDLEHQSCVGLPAPETEGSLTMAFRFRPDAGNEFQAASVTAEFTFTLHQ